MKVITLQGKNNTGKTSILKKVIDKYYRQYQNSSALVAHNRTIEHSLATKITEKGNVPEAWAAFEINGKKLVIITLGDTLKLIFDEYHRVLQKAKWGEADVFVCASHATNGFSEFCAAKFLCNPVVISSESEKTDDEIADMISEEIEKAI